MSMCSCAECGDIYDTDFQMEMIDDEMVCDSCYEDHCEKGRTDLTDAEKTEIKELILELKELISLCENAGDFSNGNMASGMDEGQVNAGMVVANAKNFLNKNHIKKSPVDLKGGGRCG